MIYRWLVVFSILFFLNRVFEPYGLKIIGQFIALSGFVGLVVQPVWELVKFFYTPGRMNKMKNERVVGDGRRGGGGRGRSCSSCRCRFR